MKGQTIVVPKGTPIHSSHPREVGQDIVSQKELRVQVSLVVPEDKREIGLRTASGGFIRQIRDEHLTHILRAMGLPHLTAEDLHKGFAEVLRRCKSESLGGGNEVLILTLAPERVRWIGSGGYWKEAPASSVRHAH